MSKRAEEEERRQRVDEYTKTRSVQTLAEMLVELEMKCEAEALRDVRRRGRRL